MHVLTWNVSFFSSYRLKVTAMASKTVVTCHPPHPRGATGRSISVPRSPTSSARRIIYNRRTATKPGPMSRYVNCARTLACCDRWRMLCLWPAAAAAFFDAPPPAALLITLICLRRTCSAWILRRHFLDWSRWKMRETLAQSQWSHWSARW